MASTYLRRWLLRFPRVIGSEVKGPFSFYTTTRELGLLSKRRPGYHLPVAIIESSWRAIARISVSRGIEREPLGANPADAPS